MKPAPNVTPLRGALGALVQGVDLSSLGDAGFQAVRDLVREYLVCLFPQQQLTAEGQVALGRRFGQIQMHAYHADLDGPVPEMLVMRSATPLADFWHVDETYEDVPPAWSILRMVQSPPSGGDTMWSNQYLAYESLPARLAQRLASLHARHVTLDGDRSAVHPVIRVHPETRRPALYVNRQFTREIIELPSHQSISLLDWLFNVAENGDFQVRYRWSANTVAIWDNRCTQHCVVGDYTEMRHAERIAVAEA